MKEKDHLQCPACGENTIAKRKVKMDGFRPCGEVLVCMLCGAELGTPEAEATEIKPKRASSALEALLGGGDEPETPTLAPEQNSHFCRDCRHFVAHPFESRCERFGRVADPMADCPHFEAKRNEFDLPDQKL